MRDLGEKIIKVKGKIDSLENEIDEAKKEQRSEAYLIALRQQLIELRKTENILLEISHKRKGSYFF